MARRLSPAQPGLSSVARVSGPETGDLIQSFTDKMRFNVDLKLNNDILLLKRLNTLLEAYSSQNVLKRGYTLVVQDGHPIKRKKDLQKKEFELRFIDGKIIAEERRSDA